MQNLMPPLKTLWPSLNVVIFPPVLRLVLVDAKEWPLRRLLKKIHEIILGGRRFSVKPIAEQLGVSNERVRSIIHEHLDTRVLSAK
jgi:energy-converting hydrogenase A subunit M